MSGFVLSEAQAACRAAHEQARLLEHLYDRLLRHEGLGSVTGYRADERHGELERFRRHLQDQLARDGLLPKEPDPEKEELLELITGVRETFSADEKKVVTERLVTEEYGLLRLGERLQRHSAAEELADGLDRTRAAIERLERLERAGSGG